MFVGGGVIVCVNDSETTSVRVSDSDTLFRETVKAEVFVWLSESAKMLSDTVPVLTTD